MSTQKMAELIGKNPLEFDELTGLWVPKGYKAKFHKRHGLFWPDSITSEDLIGRMKRLDYVPLMDPLMGPLSYHLPPFGSMLDEYIGTKPDAKKKKKTAAERKEKKRREEQNFVMSDPVRIKEVLDRYVISQEQAKIDLSIAFSEMYELSKFPDSKYQRPNILILGPTGVGKTKIISTLAKYFNMPLEIAKVGSMVQEGIVGKRFGEVFENLKRKINAAENKHPDNDYVMSHFMLGPRQKIKPSTLTSIVYLDEFDKLCDNNSLRRNVFSHSIQDQIIGFMDGEVIEGVDTSRVLFIGGGAFEGLESLMHNPIALTVGKGPKAQKAIVDVDYTDLPRLNEEELIKYGLKRELLGRFALKTCMYPLSKEHLAQILTSSEDSTLKTAREFYKERKGVAFTFTPEAIDYIATRAYEKGTGARALTGVIEEVLRPYKFRIKEHKGKEVTIGINEVQKVI